MARAGSHRVAPGGFSDATIDREACSRENRCVNEADYHEYNSTHMLVLAEVANILRNISRWSLSRPQASIPARL